MLNNKNNIISSFSILRTPFFGYGSRWTLKFHPVYSLIMLLGIGICLAASSWQYHKAKVFVRPLVETVKINGEFLNNYTRYLDNQTLDGQAGYAVITPFKHEDAIYLVNRGFIAYQNRNTLPQVPVVKGMVTIAGYLNIYAKPMLLNDRLQDPVAARVQYINHKQFSLLLHQTVEQKILHMESGTGGLSAFPKAQSYLSHHRHMGYAIQWGLLAIAGLCIWFVAGIKRGIKT